MVGFQHILVFKMENVILNYRVERNKKFNRLAKIGYIAAATFDPYGLTSLLFGTILWIRRAPKIQIYGFGLNMIIHIVATEIFDIYFNNITGTIIYSIIFATLVPIILYKYTASPTTELHTMDKLKQIETEILKNSKQS